MLVNFAFRVAFTDTRTGRRVTRQSTAHRVAIDSGDLVSAKAKAEGILMNWGGIADAVVTDIHFYGDQWRAV